MQHLDQATVLRLRQEGQTLRAIATAVGCKHPMQVLRALERIQNRSAASRRVVHLRKHLKRHEDAASRLKREIEKLESNK
jgi:hypothetical protein